MKKWRKIPESKLNSIENRFSDLRFDGVELAVHKLGLKDKKQEVYGGTGFLLIKNKPITHINQIYIDKDFQEAYNNYEDDAIYTGKAYFRMCRKYRDKEYNYLITMEDLNEPQ